VGAHLALGAAGEAQVNPVQLAVVEAHDVRPVLRTAPRSGFEGSGFEGCVGAAWNRTILHHAGRRALLRSVALPVSDVGTLKVVVRVAVTATVQ
jgi:hypothetical protein